MAAVAVEAVAVAAAAAIFPPLPPAPNPDGDGIEACCALTATYLYAIAVAIQNLKLGGTDDSAADAQCCAQVVHAIAAVAAPLAAIALELPKLAAGAPAPDFTAIVTELERLRAALTTEFDKLVAAINGGDVPVNPTPPSLANLSCRRGTRSKT